MSTSAGSWSIQQLTEFVAAVAMAHDATAALRTGAERVAEALDVDAVAVVLDGDVAMAMGWPPRLVPRDQLLAAAAVPEGARVSVPGFGRSPVTVVPIGDEPSGTLILVRIGERFDAMELGLLRAMARTLALALRSLRMLDAERRMRARSELQARENERLLGILRERQDLLEGLAAIEHSIAQRVPVEQVLDAVVRLAGQMLGDEQTLLYLRTPHDPELLAAVAFSGLPDGLADVVAHRRVGEGVAGHAVSDGRLVVVDDYPAASEAMPVFVARGLRSAMAAPIREEGVVVGSLIVSTYQHGRRYSQADREMLLTIAQHASLALTDAKTVRAMVHQALHDGLTGLPNRALFNDRLEHALLRASRTGAMTGVLFLDVDRFKTVNDSLGHAAGDDLLRAVGARIDECVRPADTAARIGGDEFAVLLEDLASPTEALTTAQRILAALCQPFSLDGRDVAVTASIGVATGVRADRDLLRHADVAMYRAKADGKGRYALYEHGMQAAVLERIELEGDLQRALAEQTAGGGELELHYQPIVRLSTGRMVGVEALLRWCHPTRGAVPPLTFVPLAEETGLIHGLGTFVLRQACHQAAAWRAAGGPEELTMHVNLSGRQLEDPELVAIVAAALEDNGVEPARLMLEITETVLMQDTEVTIERLAALRALGVRLAVDDFGTGYSSLRYLNRFPVDELKMAKPFVDRLGTGPEDSALARAIVDLGAALGLHVVAEGIERPEQRRALEELGCALGQGFLFGVPVPASELAPLIAAVVPAAR